MTALAEKRVDVGMDDLVRLTSVKRSAGRPADMLTLVKADKGLLLTKQIDVGPADTQEAAQEAIERKIEELMQVINTADRSKGDHDTIDNLQLQVRCTIKNPESVPMTITGLNGKTGLNIPAFPTNLTITKSVFVRCTIWLDQEYDYAAFGGIVLETEIKGLTDEQATERLELASQVSARNERLGFNQPYLHLLDIGKRACEECGIMFRPVRSDQVYHQRNCAARAGARRRRQQKQDGFQIESSLKSATDETAGDTIKFKTITTHGNSKK